MLMVNPTIACMKSSEATGRAGRITRTTIIIIIMPNTLTEVTSRLMIPISTTLKISGNKNAAGLAAGIKDNNRKIYPNP